jgi:hypothetical protein
VQNIESYNQYVNLIMKSQTMPLGARFNCRPRIFKVGTQFNKANMKSNPFFTGSLISLTSTAESRKRREFYCGYFSRAAVHRVEFLIQAKLSQFMGSLDSAAAKDRIVNFTFAFRCLTADIVMRYAYQQDFGALKDGALTMPFIETLTHSSDFAQWHQHFPRLFTLMSEFAVRMPESFQKRYLRPLDAIQMVQAVSGYISITASNFLCSCF